MKESDLAGILIIGKTMGQTSNQRLVKCFPRLWREISFFWFCSEPCREAHVSNHLWCRQSDLHEKHFYFHEGWLCGWTCLIHFCNLLITLFSLLFFLFSTLEGQFISKAFRNLILNTQVPKAHYKLIPRVYFCGAQNNISFYAEVHFI